LGGRPRTHIDCSYRSISGVPYFSRSAFNPDSGQFRHDFFLIGVKILSRFELRPCTRRVSPFRDSGRRNFTAEFSFRRKTPQLHRSKSAKIGSGGEQVLWNQRANFYDGGLQTQRSLPDGSGARMISDESLAGLDRLAMNQLKTAVLLGFWQFASCVPDL